MKLYKKFKRMKTSAKMGLVGTALYATTLAAPVYSAVKEEIVQPIQPINMEQITNSEQAGTLYNEKLIEYTSDKFLESKEIENLYTIKSKEKELMVSERKGLIDNYNGDIGEKIEKIDTEITQCRQILDGSKKIKSLNGTRKDLEEKILVYYPALVDKSKGNIVYEANYDLPRDYNKVFKELVIEADKILRELYNDNSLKPLTDGKYYYDLNDVLVLYNILQGKDSGPDLNKEKSILVRISNLENEKEGLLKANPDFLTLKSNIESFEKNIVKNSEIAHILKRYIDNKGYVKEFEEKFGNYNNKLSIGFLKEKFLRKKGMKRDLEYMTADIQTNQEGIILGLGLHLKSYNLTTSIEEIGNPAKTRLSWFLGSIILGVGFPVVRNLIVKKYVKGKEATGAEYILTTFVGVGNGIGGVVLDGLHPLVFPVRMLTPLVFQPVFKLFKIDPCKAIADLD